MSSPTIITKSQDTKSSKITIKPYVDPKKPNLGLEKYNMALHEGVFHDEQLACIERHGVRQYLTGLNEFAPEVKLIEDKDKREAKIKEIRTVVAQLERELAANVLDIDDDKFWDKVVLLKPNNDEFWDKINLRCGNQDIKLDPAKDPYDLIKLYAIEAGGFSIVAPSYEAARNMPVSPKFYLDKYESTVSTKIELTKLKNKALAKLENLFNKNTNKLFYIAKVVDSNSTQYKKSTPNDVIYDNMDRYINGNGAEQSLKRAIESFLEADGQDMETLKIRAIVKDSTFYKLIHVRGDGFIYHMDSNSNMGRNVSDCIEYLKNPLNDKILEDLTKKLEGYWNK